MTGLRNGPPALAHYFSESDDVMAAIPNEVGTVESTEEEEIEVRGKKASAQVMRCSGVMLLQPKGVVWEVLLQQAGLPNTYI